MGEQAAPSSPSLGDRGESESTGHRRAGVGREVLGAHPHLQTPSSPCLCSLLATGLLHRRPGGCGLPSSEQPLFGEWWVPPCICPWSSLSPPRGPAAELASLGGTSRCSGWLLAPNPGHTVHVHSFLIPMLSLRCSFWSTPSSSLWFSGAIAGLPVGPRAHSVHRRD